MMNHLQRRCIWDSKIPKMKDPREPFRIFTEDMDFFSEDCQKMVPQMVRGILTNATSQTLMEKCPNDEVLAFWMIEHAAQVHLSPLGLRILSFYCL